ncbi:MAG: hypothetical protein QM628_11645 [Propionicimonas sp.]
MALGPTIPRHDRPQPFLVDVSWAASLACCSSAILKQLGSALPFTVDGDLDKASDWRGDLDSSGCLGFAGHDELFESLVIDADCNPKVATVRALKLQEIRP